MPNLLVIRLFNLENLQKGASDICLADDGKEK